MNISLRQIALSQLVFWLALAGIGLYFVLPLRKTLRFGIDLVGGTYIALDVKQEKAIEAYLSETMHQIVKKLKSLNNKPETYSVSGSSITLHFADVNAAVAAQDIVRAASKDLGVKQNGNEVIATLSESAQKSIKQDAVERNIEVLRSRLDRIGVSETPIAQQGERTIIVEMPDVTQAEAKGMIGKAAVLEFKLVEKVGRSEQELLYEYDGELPSDLEILPEAHIHRGDGGVYYLVHKYADVSGKDLRDARADYNSQNGQMVVSFKFTPEGGEKFYELTSKNIGRPLAIVLDNAVIQAPTIRSAISEAGQIDGGFTAASAKELSLLLKSGAFVAPVSFEEERQVGPSLGAESIRQGLLSCAVGLGLLLLFAVWYYKLAGLFAILALVYNLFLVIFGLVWLKATLTLPGIAGMVLTIGMAIDASILIYERIKEELANGSPMRKAVDVGFSNAMSVILDANITTFIVGAVLYYFGTGPIQGFAVTMMLGILSTLITGLFFLRSIFDFVINRLGIQRIKI